MHVLHPCTIRLQDAASLCDRGEISRAVSKLTRAIALQPRNPKLFKQRAEAYVLLKDYHAAILNFQKVLALCTSEQEYIHERLADVSFSYGEVLFSEEKYTQALYNFEKVCEYRSEDRDSIMKRYFV